MPTVNVLDTSGKPSGTLDLKSEVFGVEVRVPLLHQAVTRELADRRTGTHDTKGRSEVSGGGRKPWKQKGTGRARQGSIRATQWKGGGKPFGPTPRSYAQDLPRTMRREALRSAVAARIADGGLTVIERLGAADGKTKSLVGTLAAVGVEPVSTLLVVASLDEMLGRAERALADRRATLPRVRVPAHPRPPRRVRARGAPRVGGGTVGMTRDPRQVILRPLMTEKSMRQKEEQNTVAFRVRPDANKVEIRTAVETIFSVKVAAVRTASFEGKLKRMGRHQGRRRDWKKAIVTLRPGHKIELVEGA